MMPGSQLHRPTRMLWIAVCAAAVGLAAMPHYAQAQEQPVQSAPNPSTAGPVGAPTSTPVPSGRHHRHHKADNSTGENAAAPAPVATSSPNTVSYANFAGTWEVQLQPGSRTIYNHFFIDAGAGNTFTGHYLEGKSDSVPVNGEIDGDRFRITGQDAKGPFMMTGYEENSTNMVGLMQQGNTRVPFTATHESTVTRPKSEGPRKDAKHERHHHKHGQSDEELMNSGSHG